MGIQKRNPFMSLSLKLLLSFSLIFTLVFAAVFWWFYDFSTKTALNELNNQVEQYIKTTASGINGDEFEQLSRFPNLTTRSTGNNRPGWRNCMLLNRMNSLIL